MSHVVECPKCHSGILADRLQSTTAHNCFGCGLPVTGLVFPALNEVHTPPPSLANPATGEDAVCFYRADQRATAVCEKCGVFVSEMYRVRLGDSDYCTNCFANAKQDGSIPELTARSTLRDSQALIIAIVPLLLAFPVVVVTAPYVLYLVLRYWKNPGGMVKRSKWRMVLAGVIGLLELIGGLAFAYFVWKESV
jgi:hypothetical protein